MILHNILTILLQNALHNIHCLLEDLWHMMLNVMACVVVTTSHHVSYISTHATCSGHM